VTHSPAGFSAYDPDVFADRHIGPREREVRAMLELLGYDSLDALVDAAVPTAIRSDRPLDRPPARRAAEVLADLREIAGKNQVKRQMIGLGYYPTITPPVIRRNVLESPAWYTAYTPYQPEISQGRLEALLNFQTMVADLTGLPTANASLLDEATAAAEAVTLMHRGTNRAKTSPDRLIIDADCLPQTIAVISTRAEPLGLTVEVADLEDGLPDGDLFGVVLQYPGASGRVRDLRPVIDAAHERDALVTVAADLLALTLLTSPGELGADVVVGSSVSGVLTAVLEIAFLVARSLWSCPLSYAWTCAGVPGRCECPGGASGMSAAGAAAVPPPGANNTTPSTASAVATASANCA
jgi:glycine dehydrogenase